MPSGVAIVGRSVRVRSWSRFAAECGGGDVRAPPRPGAALASRPRPTRGCEKTRPPTPRRLSSVRTANPSCATARGSRLPNRGLASRYPTRRRTGVGPAQKRRDAVTSRVRHRVGDRPTLFPETAARSADPTGVKGARRRLWGSGEQCVIGPGRNGECIGSTKTFVCLFIFSCGHFFH